MSKAQTCEVCETLYVPFNSTDKVCSVPCAIELVKRNNKKKADKAWRKEKRARKQALKTKSDWLKEAQVACNAYIKVRDKDEGCISCSTTKPDIQYCAGHYKTRGGHPELRFHPFNIHKQCNQYCNLQLSGNISNYRANLVKKIGISQVEWLEGPQEAQHWTIEDIQEIKQYYREQLRHLINENQV